VVQLGFVSELQNVLTFCSQNGHQKLCIVIIININYTSRGCRKGSFQQMEASWEVTPELRSNIVPHPGLISIQDGEQNIQQIIN
jgi:hypothetical protein